MTDAPRATPPRALHRIGIFGGAFDPPHNAHHALAQAALSQFELDVLLLMPTGHAWHKSRTLTPAHHRVAMTRLAFQDLSHVQVDEREIQRTGPTYTVDTLSELQAQHPQAQLFLFMGSDQVQAFQSWHQWQRIANMATLVEARRSAASAPAVSAISAANGLKPAQWHNTGHEKPLVAAVLQMPDLPCNATDIRASLSQGQPISEWLSPSVWHYIQQHRLYQTTLPNDNPDRA